jgi:uncharacterized protein (TIGR02266 family)
LITDQDVELARQEHVQAQEESNLHAELTRILAATTDYERRLKQLHAAMIDAQKQGASDPHLAQRVRALVMPALDAETPFEPARQLRIQALESRSRATHEVRSRIAAFRAQVQQLGQSLTTEEKAVQRSAAQAKQAALARAQAQAEAAEPADDPFSSTLIAQGPPPGLRRASSGTLPPGAVPVAKITPPRPAGQTIPKRQSPRVRMQAQVDFESDDNFFNGFSANISDGGVFVATVNVLPLGTQVDVGFTLPTGERIECKGVVRWVREVDDKQPDIFPGMGIQFVDLDPRGAKAIETFIQQREPMFYVE